MLRSAILRTLTHVEPGLLWVKPRGIGVIGNQVCLTAQTGNPEAVIRVCGKQRDKSRGRIGRVTHGHMEFVSGHDLQTRIAVLPPELVAYGNYSNRVARLGSLLDTGDHTRRGQE